MGVAAGIFVRSEAVHSVMAVVPEDTFVSVFNRLSRKKQYAFVLLLFNKQGWNGSIETINGQSVLTLSKNAESKRLYLEQPAPSWGDRLRARIRQQSQQPPLHDDIVVWDAAAVRNLLLYGIDRSAAEALYQNQFGRSLTYTETEHTSSDALQARPPLMAVVLVLVVCLAGAAIATGIIPLFETTDASEFDRGMEFDGSDRFINQTNQSATTDNVDQQQGYPPGTSASGVTDSSALAEAHRDTLTGAQYVFSIRESGPATATEFPDVVSRRIDGEVANETVYRFEEQMNYTVDATRRNTSVEIYANGETEYRRSTLDSETQTEIRGSPEGTAAATGITAQVVERYLNTPNTSIEEDVVFGTAAYIVESTTPPEEFHAAVDDYRALAIIQPTGRVDFLRVQYTAVGEDEPARFEMQIVAVDGQFVEEPRWIDEVDAEKHEEPEWIQLPLHEEPHTGLFSMIRG